MIPVFYKKTSKKGNFFLCFVLTNAGRFFIGSKMAGITINTTAKIITPAKFQKRCESLLKQKIVRFTQEEKQEIKKISQISDVAKGFNALSFVLTDKLNNIGEKGYDIKNGRRLVVGNFISGIYARLNFKNKKLLMKPERAADIYDKMAKYEEKAYKFLSNLVYQSSSNVDVLEIEHNLRKKGVKAKFSDNSSLDFAKLTKEALEDLAKKGYELPKRIFVSRLLSSIVNGCVSMGPTKPAETIFLNSKIACNTLNSIKNTQKMKYSLHRFST